MIAGIYENHSPVHDDHPHPDAVADHSSEERRVWLEGQGKALEAALKGAPLESSMVILVQTVCRLLGDGARAGFYLKGPEGSLHHLVGMGDEYAAAVDGFEVGPASLACGLATHTGVPVFTPDVKQEPRWADWLWLAEKFDYRACWSVPMHTAVEQYAGTLAVYWRQPREADATARQIVTQVAQTAALILSRHREMEGRLRSESALRQSEQTLQSELEDTKLLQRISAVIIEPNDTETLFQNLVDAAHAIMRADFASMQRLHPSRGKSGELELLGSHGFPEEAVRFWKWVSTESNCTCGIALRTRDRVIDADIAQSQIMAGTPDQAALLQNGMRAAQSTPLISRSGELLGMISTHWRQPHQPSTRDLRLLDVLARQAADVIERQQAREADQMQTARLALLCDAAALLLKAEDPDTMLRSLFERIAPHLGLDAYFNFVVNDSGDALRLASCAGVSEKTKSGLAHLEFGQAICGTAAQLRQRIVATEVQQSDDPKVQLVRSLGIRAYVCNILEANGRLLGTLSFASRSRDRFDAGDLSFLETVTSYVAVARERLRLVDELRSADRRKDEFLATLAHELRNPLAPIHHAVEMLGHRKLETAQLPMLREVIQRQVQSLTRLINDLMDVSRITRNRLELNRQPLELGQLVRNAVETSGHYFEARSHQLAATLPPQPVYFEGDEVRLGQVLQNLLSNAAKYTGPGGQVRLSAGIEDADIVIRIEDNGIGIAAEHLSLIFDDFYQVDRSLEKTEGGLGIGLSLVRRLVELHGGRVEAYSAGRGAGSAFTVRLPLPVGVSAAVPSQAPAQPLQTALSRRVLIVDDNRDSADTLAALLRITGNEVHVAYDGRAGLQAAEQLQPELLLLDIGLPGLNGYELCRAIRAQNWSRKAVMAALTGWGQDQDRRESHAAGFDAHLVKPVDFAALTQLLALPARAAMPAAAAA